MTQNRLLIAIFSVSLILSGWFVFKGINENTNFPSGVKSELNPVNQPEASEMDKQLVGDKQVLLVADVGDKDQFGRLLRYVYLPEPNHQFLFVNDYLVREGYAVVDTIKPNIAKVTDFEAAQVDAKKNERGLWAKCSN